METPALGVAKPRTDFSVGLLRADQLREADRIFRLAFGTFVGLPDPLQFMGDADLVRPRWRASPDSAFSAEGADGALLGSNFASNWGSVGFFGPLTVRPDMWGRGIAQRLLELAMVAFRSWGTAHIGLFTFPHSPMHLALYQKFGFRPRALTAVMSKAVVASAGGSPAVDLGTASQEERASALDAARELTEAVYSGLDLSPEMLAVLEQGTGDVVMLWDGDRLDAFAVCHCGAGSEAGSGSCYVKFGAARSGPRAEERFERLLEACEMLAAGRGAQRLQAGVNTARSQAYETMLRRGFRIDILGIAMHRPNEPGYSQPDIFVMDDWR
jgi:GNAT superfamily N-acetyltransferase